MPKTTEDAVCKNCGKTGVITLTERGYLPDPYDLRDLGWYWSNRDNCWYCIPCEGTLISNALKELMGLCEKNNVKVYDLGGTPLNKAAEADSNDGA